MRTTTTVLISGASIAGPALAYWLGERGFQPTVVERAPRLRAGGYPIDVRGAAVTVADRMGMLADIRAAKTDMHGLAFVDTAGRTRARTGMEVFDGSGHGTDVELLRGELSRLLYERTAGRAEYVFDDSVTSLEQHGDGVRVTFERAEPRDFDLVVAADGLHSNVRALTFGAEQQFRRFLGHYVSIFSMPHESGVGGWAVLHSTPGRIAGLYKCRGERNARAILGFASPHELRYDHRDTEAQQRILRSTFADGGWEIPAMLAGMPDADDFYFDSISQIRMDTWSRGRVALLGDAGYSPSPLAGQGSSLALVGAYVLAAELATADGDHRVAFRRYEDRMRDFVRRNQEIATTGARTLIPDSRARIWLRDQAIRLASVAPWVVRLNGRVARAANAIELDAEPDRGAPLPG